MAKRAVTAWWWERAFNLAVIVSFLSAACFTAGSGSGVAWAQTTPQLKTVTSEFIPEPGSPVEVTSAKVDLEVDAFDTPIAARVYLDYRNAGDRVINAVKFRVGYVDAQGKVRGTFHAPDANVLSPGGTASQKWRGERVDPRVQAVKVRTLQVKYADGSTWQSAKMNNVVTPDGDTGGGGGGAGPEAAPAAAPATAAPEAAPTSAVPAPDVPQAGSVGAQSWSGTGKKSISGDAPADSSAPADASAEPATGTGTAEYESVTKSSKRFGSQQPAEDTAGAATYDSPPPEGK